MPTLPRSRAVRPAVFLAGVLSAGYGALILLQLLAHESLWVGAGLFVFGAGLLAWSARRAGGRKPARDVPLGQKIAFGAFGGVAALGVVAYNVATGSDLSLPEAAILVYGVGLLAASPYLGTRVGPTDVGTLAAWSLPLAAAPLGLYAVDAYFDARIGAGNSPLDAFIVHGLVAPMSAALNLLGFDTTATGQVVGLTTPRGKLFLTVGVVCAGLEPGILFLGVFGLYAWQEQTPPKRLALLLGLGLVGIYIANLLRLVLLAFVGYHRGGTALQQVHAHAGWVLFVGWMMLYWWLVLRRFQGSGTPAV